VGRGAAQLRIDAKPHAVEPGRDLTLDLPPGAHPMSVRSSDGTVVWATGSLEVAPGEPLVVQIGEGRMPEVSGAGAFNPASSKGGGG
jgi:hypothetical protein